MAKKQKVEKVEKVETEKLEDEDVQIEASIENSKKMKKLKKEKKKSKILPKVISLFMLIGLGLFIYFNIFDFRNKYIIPIVQKVPIVKNVFPVSEQQGENSEELTKEELIIKKNDLEKQLVGLKDINETLDKKNIIYTEEISRLQDIEYQQLKYKKDKEEFDTLVASGDKKAFIQFYEKLSPENADKLYKEAVVSTQQTKEMKNFISTFSSMDEGSAAKILEEMLGTDMDLVVDILKNVGTETSAAILGAMDTKNAASIAKRMAPENQP